MATQLFTDFPELEKLSREDLEDLLNDPAYFQAYFHSLPQVKALFQEQLELEQANEEIAKSNLAMQDDLYKLRSDTQAAFDEAKSLEARWKELEKEQKELYQRYSAQFLLLRLRHATTALDEESESLATEFVQSSSNGDSAEIQGKEVDEFVKKFKDLRKVYHKRVMWGDRWTSGTVEWPDN